MKILYICTHNRCRSILSEAITNNIAAGVIVARSAGSQPAGVVHPLSLKYLAQQGYSTEDLKSQSWDEFESFAPDIVVTVCDSAAGEACPVWFGKSITIHWGLNDPSKIDGDDAQIEAAFKQCIHIVEQRVEQLKSLAIAYQESGDTQDQLRSSLAALGAKL